MDEDPCEFAREVADECAKFSYKKEIKTKKALEALPTFLANWWKGWKPFIRVEAQQGIAFFTTKTDLPPKIYACRPTNAQIRAALPDEITKGFGADPVKIETSNGCFDISISIATPRAAALKRMRKEGENDADDCAPQGKKGRSDQSLEEEKAAVAASTAAAEDE